MHFAFLPGPFSLRIYVENALIRFNISDRVQSGGIMLAYIDWHGLWLVELVSSPRTAGESLSPNGYEQPYGPFQVAVWGTTVLTLCRVLKARMEPRPDGGDVTHRETSR